MSKLQILIPQYNESDNIIRPLLDSIAIQQDIDFNDIEVFIGNDGSDTKLSIDFLKTYTYRIQYHYFEHRGLAATRYQLQELATADYIMFCDADDKFINTMALRIILNILKESPDALICDFLEEHKTPFLLVPHHNDSVYVHGKIYRRQFLLDNQIQWHPHLKEHQDSPYNVLARILSKKTMICSIPLYMWCDNPNSICRKNPKYHRINTWCAMINSYDSLIDDLKNRGIGSHAIYYSMWCLYATYWNMASPACQEDCVADARAAVYTRLFKFYKDHELLIKKCTPDKEQEISKRLLEITKTRGPMTEMPPFKEWLNSLITLYQ